jgi:hypothetical protein
MGFIKRFKLPIFWLFVVLSAIFLSTSGLVASLKAEDSSPAEQETTAAIEADKANSQETSDPNSLQEDEDTNDFSPRLSSFIEINEIYARILTPELIRKNGLVDYSTLRRKRADMIDAAKALKDMNPAVLMFLSREEKIAFWINTYNICTLKLVIDNYPITPKLYMIFYPDNSIMQISGNWRTKYFFEIQGLEYTLEEIEKEFLLDRYQDPRICFALSYASIGGAILRPEPYTAEKLDEQLDDQVRAYLQTPQGLHINRNENVIYLSNLFTMHNHKEVFLSSEYGKIKKFRDRKPEEQAWLNFIWNYLPDEDKRYLETASYTIKFLKYDWLLNETS